MIIQFLLFVVIFDLILVIEIYCRYRNRHRYELEFYIWYFKLCFLDLDVKLLSVFSANGVLNERSIATRNRQAGRQSNEFQFDHIASHSIANSLFRSCISTLGNFRLLLLGFQNNSIISYTINLLFSFLSAFWLLHFRTSFRP